MQGLACFLHAFALLRFDRCLIFSNHHPTPRPLSTWQRQPAALNEDIRFFRRLFGPAVMMLIGRKIECEMSQPLPTERRVSLDPLVLGWVCPTSRLSLYDSLMSHYHRCIPSMRFR